jgi:pantetheine-phosphate adenylyltransferase
MIQQGARMFDKLVVAVGHNPEKKGMFSVTERLGMLGRIIVPENAHVSGASFDGFLIHYAKRIGADFLLRGIRSATDYDYERTMRHINEDLAPGITTVFLMPPREIAEVSSSMVKGLTGPEGWEKLVSKYVSDIVLEKLQEKVHG